MINLRKLTTVAAIASCAFILSACSLYNNSSNGNQAPSGQTGQQTGGKTGGSQQQTQQGQTAATVTFSDSGVSPATVTIKSGQSITWVNNSSKTIQVASDPHPTHTDNRELSNGQSVLDLAPGASTAVTLNKKGTWGFHDHLNPSVRGKVVVQ